MGLTIHYSLATDRTKLDEVRSLVKEFRRLAQQLPFQEVREIVEFQGNDCQHDKGDDAERWLKIQAGQYVEQGGQDLRIMPQHFIAFTTVPGAGSEPANIGLARYPDSIQVECHGRKQRVRTGLQGWSWKSFCKTQYASSAQCGGVTNFVRCHLSVVSLLDAIKGRQLATVDVSDEGGYWDHRDIRKLAETVGEWNEMIAAAVGKIKDAGLFQVEAPIKDFPDFEHLEARGLDKPNRPAS